MLIPATTAPPPSDEAIAKVAYEKYLARECRHGFDRDDWAEARRELVAEMLMISRSQRRPLDA